MMVESGTGEAPTWGEAGEGVSEMVDENCLLLHMPDNYQPVDAAAGEYTQIVDSKKVKIEYYRCKMRQNCLWIHIQC